MFHNLKTKGFKNTDNLWLSSVRITFVFAIKLKKKFDYLFSGSLVV